MRVFFGWWDRSDRDRDSSRIELVEMWWDMVGSDVIDIVIVFIPRAFLLALHLQFVSFLQTERARCWLIHTYDTVGMQGSGVHVLFDSDRLQLHFTTLQLMEMDME